MPENNYDSVLQNLSLENETWEHEWAWGQWAKGKINMW